MDDDDAHNRIARLEQRIDDLAARIESCRKLILAARVAVIAGGILLAAILLGAVVYNPAAMAAAMAAIAGGIAVWGSNISTRQEATAELAAAEADRAALITLLDLRLVGERDNSLGPPL
jgi:hypothetical protein